MFKKYNLEEFDDDEETINFNIFNEEEQVSSKSFEEEDEDIHNLEDYEEIIDLTDFENINELSSSGYEIYDNLDFIEILDGNEEKNNISKDKKTFNLNSDINVVPEIKIEVIKDNNEEKLVKFSLNVILDNEREENIVIDLNISQKTYLMIAEELFK